MITRLCGKTELRGRDDGKLSLVTIVETLINDDDNPIYHAQVDYRRRGHDLYVLQGGFCCAEDAINWAAGFQWFTRKTGSLIWVGAAEDATRWYAQIGASTAEIAVFTAREGDAPHYTVTRSLELGGQWIEFQIGDNTLDNERRGIVSFEHASTIALTMPDYVMELVRSA
ncbi:hypothetical protein AQ610_12450 [Burkholderia humptydooensis]|nr:hypothetical protein AQ610_12450 [Burkholderia humptydooensis]